MTADQHQLDTVARSQAALDRAMAYEQHLVGRVAGVTARIEAARASRVSAAIGGTECEPQAEISELATVTTQHALAAKARTVIEAEHARHVADLDTMFGSSATARSTLKTAHAAREAAVAVADAAKSLLDRGNAHLTALEAKLEQAAATEREHDTQAAARLQSALQSGQTPAETTEPVQRHSIALEGDVRTARFTIDRLAADHNDRIAELAAADQAVRAAADGVLLSEAERVATELQAVETRAAVLRRRLTSFTERHPAGSVPSAPNSSPARQVPGGWFVRDATAYAPPLKIRQTPIISAALASPTSVLERSGPYAVNWTAEAESWNRFAAALVSDAQAEPSFAPVPPYPAARAA